MRTALDATLQRRGCGEYSYVGVLQKENSQCSAFCKAKDVFQEIAGGVLWPKKGFG